MRRILVVYNPKSSKFKEVTKSVILPLREDYVDLVEYKIKPTNFDDNTHSIANIIRDGDIIISAGGDGTSAIASNAILLSEKRGVSISYLGFGNFNDLARTWTKKKNSITDIIKNATKTVKIRPLELFVNDHHFRFAIAYATIGMVAGSVYEFEKQENREKLYNGGANFVASFLTIAPYYFKHHKTASLPDYATHKNVVKNTTDYLALNGPRMAKIRHSSDLYNDKKFKVARLNLSKILPAMPFTAKSALGHMPGEIVDADILQFNQPTDLDFQSEGEYIKLQNVKKIEIKKSKKQLSVISF